MRDGAQEMGMHGHPGGGGGFEVLGSLIGGMFLLGILVVVLWAASRLLFVPSGGSGGKATDTAENILRERFARGEIPAEEYEKSLEVLRDSASDASSAQPGDEPPRGRYESYVRDAIERLRPGRGADS